MIKINLLPVEKRKTERTPLPRFMLILATAATAAVLGFWVFWAFMQCALTEKEIAQKQKELNDLQPKVKEYEELAKKVDLLKNKIKEIDSVTTRDVDWWRAMSALWDEIHAHPKVWIDDLKVQGEGAAGAELKRVHPDSQMNPGPMYAVTFRAHVGGMEVAEMTRFRTALKTNTTLQELLPTLNFNLDWTVSPEDGFDEKHSIGFSITLLGPGKKYERPKTPAPGTKPPAAPGSPVSAPQKGTR